MQGEQISRLRQTAEAIARELTAAPSFVKRTWTATLAEGGERYDLTAEGLDTVGFYIQRSKTYGRYTLSGHMPQEFWKHQPTHKEIPTISIAADREPSKAAAYMMTALVLPALSFAEETEQRREATERKQRQREESAAYLIEASGGLLRRRDNQSAGNSWRDTVPLTCTVFDANELTIEGQADTERVSLSFTKLTIEEGANILRVLAATRATQEERGQEEGEDEEGVLAGWREALDEAA